VQPVTSDLAASLQLTKVGGALVNEVQTGSAADRAGIKRGDAIVAVNGQDVADSNELRNRIAQLGPGASVELTIVRNGETQMVKATLEALASNSAANAGASSSADERTAGLVVEPLTPQRARQLGLTDDRGLLVTGVDPNGPAAEAGIRTGDVIRQVDGQALSSADDLRRALSDGDRPALVLMRRGAQNMFVPLPRLG
jgi:S1-C subfamily serine protease